MKLKKIFFTFLDISGVLLGIYIIALGYAITSGRHVSGPIGTLTVLLGIGAFLIHFGHYFNLSYIRWMFGSDYFLKNKGQ